MKNKKWEIIELWDSFGDLAMNPETECMEESFLGFPKGTHREEIWHWFEDTFHVIVGYLVNYHQVVFFDDKDDIMF
ncbi:MAG: hypothetical protein [Bacteriophage sp.]|nr:MAG: hypothetical protein [Bacteriophage sp.]